jgi:NAD(P)-dependent dehydrogenase (short-subunit alcohol dehydrogenase family)
MLKQFSLEGRVAIVTGGGTGLGLEMVRHLARAGADLVIAGRRAAPIEGAAAEVKAAGPDAIAVPTDVSDSAQANALIQASLDHYGRIDALINNAALVSDSVPVPIWDLTDEDWQAALDVNLSGAFYCARAVSKPMADQGWGKIINVSSGFGLRGGRDIYTYCCTKGGIIQLTRVLSFSLARYGITANSIVPGFIPTEGTDTEMRESLPRSGAYLPIGKLGVPQDIGPVAVFLASPASDYMTGEIFTLDGGGLAAGLAPTGYAPEISLEP